MVFGLGIFLLLMDRIMHAAGEDTGRLMIGKVLFLALQNFLYTSYLIRCIPSQMCSNRTDWTFFVKWHNVKGGRPAWLLHLASQESDRHSTVSCQDCRKYASVTIARNPTVPPTRHCAVTARLLH